MLTGRFKGPESLDKLALMMSSSVAGGGLSEGLTVINVE